MGMRIKGNRITMPRVYRLAILTATHYCRRMTRRIFFGAAIQGVAKRGERSPLYQSLIQTIKAQGFTVLTEHAGGESKEETARLLESSIGPLPPLGTDRLVYVRNKMIELVESDVAGAIFEVSVPSLGTGVEIAHAYLRPRLGLSMIPILALYQAGFWPNQLSTMVRGLTPATAPSFTLKEFQDGEAANGLVKEFLRSL